MSSPRTKFVPDPDGGPGWVHQAVSPSVPKQVSTCSCPADAGEYDACNGESYYCDCCGEHFDDPLPFAEPMESASPERLRKASGWYWYCKPCGEEWIKDGATVVLGVTP